MHFWIDKRGGGCGLRMVTPVHRFHSVESARRVGGAPHHLHHHHHNPPPHQHHRPYAHHAGNGSYLNGGHSFNAAGGEIATDGGVYVDMGPAQSMGGVGGGGGGAPPPLMAAHLKCGMLSSFGLACVFVAGAKLYFERHAGAIDQGFGVLVLCAMLTICLLAACTVSLCRARPPPPQLPLVAIATPQPSSPQNSSEEMTLGTMLSLQAQHQIGRPPSPEPPPPPYHIAVLLPQRDIIQHHHHHHHHHPHPQQHSNNAQEAPPPSYEKAIS